MNLLKTTIGKIAVEIRTGKTPPTKNAGYFNGDINWYTPGDLDLVKYLGLSTRTISQIALDDKKAITVPANTILISCIGNIGKLGITREEASFNQQITGVIVDKQKLDWEYFYYWLKRNQHTLSNSASNAIVPILNNKQLASITITYTEDLTDQKRIAKVLSMAEELIQKRKQTIALLDDYLKSVFLDMFGDPATNPKGFTIEYLSKFYVDPKNGTKCGPFGSALKKADYQKNGVPVWNMDNITVAGDFVNKPSLWISNEKYKELKAYSVHNGDVIISRAGTVGKMCVVKSNYDQSLISTNLIRVRFNDNLLPLYFVSLMNYFKGRVGRLRTGEDGTFTHMNTTILDNLKFPYPPKPLQDKFAAIVAKAETIKEQYELSLRKLEDLYGSLSQQAFKGKLDVSRVSIEDTRYGDPFEGHEYEELLDLDKAKEILEEKRKAAQEKLEEGKKKIAPPKSRKKDNKTDENAADEEYLNFTGDEESDTEGKSWIGGFEPPDEIGEAPKGSLDDSRNADEEIIWLAPPPKKLRETVVFREATVYNGWERYSDEELARMVRQKFSGSDFTSDMLIDFLVKNLGLSINYFSSEDLKLGKKIRGRRDFKKWLFSCVEGENQYLKLKQFFHDDYRSDRQLVIPADYIKSFNEKDNTERFGIYFNVVL